MRVKVFFTVFLVLFTCSSSAFAAGNVRVSAKAAIIMEAATGRVLFAQNEHERLAMASTTKILTSLIALEQPDIDAVFKVDSNAIKVDGSSMGLVEGDSASLRALAIGMLLPSGNDGANAAAVRIAGSNADFAVLMNKRAKEIGMTNSSFETPSGLDSENHYSTAYDMALLAREALKNDVFASICSQYSMTAVYGNPPYERRLTNHNRLLNSYDGAIGMKTGFTDSAGRCLVTAAKRDGITLICVTLNCSDDWGIHSSLYDRFFPQISLVDLTANMPEANIKITGGTAATVPAVNYETVELPLPASGADVEYKMFLQPFLYAPVKAGRSVGEVEIFVDGEKLTAISLITAAPVPAKHEYVEKQTLLDKIWELFESLQ